MTTNVRVTIGSLLLAALCCAAATCGTSPVAPRSDPTVTLTAVRISGPSSLAPGATGQFTAIAEYSDGSKVDVTSNAVWSSSAAGVIAFASGTPGGAMAVGRGEATVTAARVRISLPMNVVVLEPGTYRLSGLITDEGEPLRSAAVEITAGTGTGLQTTSDQLGRYAVYGVAGGVDVRVSAPGFSPVITPTEVGGNTVVDFSLRSLVAPPDIRGEWILTVTASSACSARLPEAARERRYAVDITQDGSRVHLRGSNLFLDGRITGTVLAIPMEGDSGIFEAIAGIGTLGIEGIMTAVMQEQEIRGTLDGSISIYGASVATCRDQRIEFVLRRSAR